MAEKYQWLILLAGVPSLVSPFYIWMIRNKIKGKECRLKSFEIFLIVFVWLCPALNLAIAITVGGLLLGGAHKEWPNRLGDGFEDI